MLLIRHRLLAWLGILGLIVVSNAIAGIIFFGSIDRLLDLPQAQAVEIRSFNTLSQLSDEEWLAMVQRDGGRLPINSDQASLSTEITLRPGSYRFITRGYIFPLYHQSEPLAGIYPELVFQASTDKILIVSEEAPITTGSKYIIGPTFQLTEPSSLQLELSIMDPGIDIDPRVSICPLTTS